MIHGDVKIIRFNRDGSKRSEKVVRAESKPFDATPFEISTPNSLEHRHKALYTPVQDGTQVQRTGRVFGYNDTNY